MRGNPEWWIDKIKINNLTRSYVRNRLDAIYICLISQNLSSREEVNMKRHCATTVFIATSCPDSYPFHRRSPQFRLDPPCGLIRSSCLMLAAHATDALTRVSISVRILPACKHTRTRSMPFDSIGKLMDVRRVRKRGGDKKERGPGASEAV